MKELSNFDFLLCVNGILLETEISQTINAISKIKNVLLVTQLEDVMVKDYTIAQLCYVIEMISL
jgi:hypothetical protein